LSRFFEQRPVRDEHADVGRRSSCRRRNEALDKRLNSDELKEDEDKETILHERLAEQATTAIP
jgi:hypothetical protein